MIPDLKRRWKILLLARIDAMGWVVSRQPNTISELQKQTDIRNQSLLISFWTYIYIIFQIFQVTITKTDKQKWTKDVKVHNQTLPS